MRSPRIEQPMAVANVRHPRRVQPNATVTTTTSVTKTASPEITSNAEGGVHASNQRLVDQKQKTFEHKSGRVRSALLAATTTVRTPDRQSSFSRGSCCTAQGVRLHRLTINRLRLAPLFSARQPPDDVCRSHDTGTDSTRALARQPPSWFGPLNLRPDLTLTQVKGDRYPGAAERRVGDGQLAAVGGGDVGGDGEPEPGASLVTGATFVKAERSGGQLRPADRPESPARRRRRGQRPALRRCARSSPRTVRSPHAPRWRRDDRTPGQRPLVAHDRRRSLPPISMQTCTGSGMRIRGFMTLSTGSGDGRRHHVDDGVEVDLGALVRHLVAAGEQQEVVDEQLQPFDSPSNTRRSPTNH